MDIIFDLTSRVDAVCREAAAWTNAQPTAYEKAKSIRKAVAELRSAIEIPKVPDILYHIYQEKLNMALAKIS